MANKTRGEVEIVLAGHAYVLRPTFAAQVEIEDRTGLAMLALYRLVVAGSARTRDAAIAIWCGAKACDPKSAGALVEVGDRLVEEGLTTPVVAALGDFFAAAVGGVRAARAGEAAPESPTPPADPGSAG